MLLSAGADVTVTTDDGASALDISRVVAARHRANDMDGATANHDAADLLVAHGATYESSVPGLRRRRGVDSTPGPAQPAAPHLGPRLDAARERSPRRQP